MIKIMKVVKNYTFKKFIDEVLGNIVHFTANCELFPNFNIKGKVVSYYTNQYSLILKVKIQAYNKIIDVDTNMANLKFEVIKKGDLY